MRISTLKYKIIRCYIRIRKELNRLHKKQIGIIKEIPNLEAQMRYKTFALYEQIKNFLLSWWSKIKGRLKQEKKNLDYQKSLLILKVCLLLLAVFVGDFNSLVIILGEILIAIYEIKKRK